MDLKVSHMVKIIYFFTEVNCMPSKLNYFVFKEQSTISLNHFDIYLEVSKEGWDI